MEAVSAKHKEKQIEKNSLNLGLLEEKVVHLIEMLQILKNENAALKDKNKDMQGQMRALEGSLVAETKDLEELSQEKMATKMVVDNLLHSIDALSFEIKEM